MDNPINYWYQKYLALKAKMDEMMNGAVEYEVGMHGEPIKITFDKYVQRAKGIFPGDKIKIIIVKEEKNGTE